MAKVNREGKALVLSQEQLRAVFAELGYPHSAIAALCYWTASRPGEIVALPTAAIGQEAVTIRQFKTKATKEVDYYPELRAALDGLLPTMSRYCFPGRADRPDQPTHLTLRAFQKQLEKAFEQLSIKGATSYSFRRSMATHLYLDGVDLQSIRLLTGHKTLASLTEYIDIPRLEARGKVAASVSRFWKKVA